MTRNEAREKIGLSPIDGGDDIYISANLFPLGSEPSVPAPDVPDNDEDVEDYTSPKYVKELVARTVRAGS